MTHADLVEKARKWLWTQGCAVVITEMTSGESETPDAIGFHPGYSIVVECKASRADFLGDRNKCHRRIKNSMGDRRYFLASEGIIKNGELPEKHGLLKPYGNGIQVLKNAGWFQEKNSKGEIMLLISAMRRIEGINPKGTSVRSYYYQTKCRATLGIKPDTDKGGK